MEELQVTQSGNTIADSLPRSRRVPGVVSPLVNFSLEPSPPIPVRSPLRPPARSISNNSTSSMAPPRPHRPTTPPPLDIDDYATIVEDAVPLPFQLRRRSFISVTDDITATKALPVRPDSPISVEIDDVPEITSSSSSFAPMSKRQHALHELLSSERAYASDLALIREVHMPLAIGRPTSLPGTTFDSSASPPMTVEDARIIFSNIEELAVFSDDFCTALQIALAFDSEEGMDHVGALFLEVIPDLEPPYKHYITRHPAALTHLGSLPSTPALTAYLTHTQSVASSHSHAWDLASLLIKPVQRLLKYPLLLGAIIDETPETHADKASLIEARKRMEEVARNVNEGRRRAEVVKEVLSAKKKGVGVGVSVAASVNLTKMKSVRKQHQVAGDLNGEAVKVEKMQKELKQVEVFVQQFARDVVEWGRAMSGVVASLHTWAVSFGKVIGISEDQESEAFDAFLAVVSVHLEPLCIELESKVNGELLKDLAGLLKTMNQPLKLLASMNEQAPFHYHLLTMSVSARNRPPPSLLAASTNYLALRGQLASELPTYLRLLYKGLDTYVFKFAAIQATFWGSVRDHWADLWEMLRVEGEMNAGWRETVEVWRRRWGDVDVVVGALKIGQVLPGMHAASVPVPVSVITQRSAIEQAQYVPSTPTPSSASSTKKSSNVMGMLAALEPAHSHPYAAPNPSYSPPIPTSLPYTVSGPLPLARSTKTRARGASDASAARKPSDTTAPRKSSDAPVMRKNSDASKSTTSVSTSKKSVTRKPSIESLRSTKPSGSSSSTLKKKVEETPAPPPKLGTIPRTKSMPLPLERVEKPEKTEKAERVSLHAERTERISLTSDRTVSHRSSASSKTLVGTEGDASARHSQEIIDEGDRGRSSRKPSLRRKFADSLKPTHRRSNSKPTAGSRTSFFDDFDTIASPPLPTPSSTTFAPHTQRDSWVTKRAKYVCQVVHPCKPPAMVSYFSFPFFTLLEGDLYEVLQEAGHPSIHPKLPLYVDDGEDCLLLCRDENGNVGWALASFLAPLGLSTD